MNTLISCSKLDLTLALFSSKNSKDINKKFGSEILQIILKYVWLIITSFLNPYLGQTDLLFVNISLIIFSNYFLIIENFL